MNVFRTQKKPFESILEAGLNYWVRSQCKSIGSLKITIKGLSLGFINNQISDIHLIAKKVNFKNLHFDELDLKAQLIKVKLNLIKKDSNIISITDDFNIEGRLSMSEDNINQVLKSKKWDSFDIWIKSNFFNAQENLYSNIKDNFLIIKAFDGYQNKINIEEKIFSLYAIDGKLVFKETNSCHEKSFPMEESIYINDAYFSNNSINFSIISKVKP